MGGEKPLKTLINGETYFDQNPLTEVKDKQTHYRPGDAVRVPGVSQIARQ